MAPTAAEVHASEAYLEKEFKSAQKAMAKLVRAGRILKRVRYQIKDPSINASVIVANRVQQTSALFNLPLEIVHKVWQHLPTVADRLSLALTCKDNAAIFEATKDIRIRKKYRFLFPRPQRTTKVHRLQVLVRLQSWVPSDYRLCYRCIQFIDLRQAINSGAWGGATEIVNTKLATEKAILKGPRCALCMAADRVDMAKHKETYKQYKKLVKSVKNL